MFERTHKHRTATAQTESDNEGMFQKARHNDKVLNEFLTQLDMEDELSYFFDIFRHGAFNYEESVHLSCFKTILIEGDSLPDAVKVLIKTNEQYARRFYDELIEEYKGFHA